MLGFVNFYFNSDVDSPPVVVAVLMLFYYLAGCFAGYVLFRVFQTIFWTTMGAIAGSALAHWLRVSPSYFDLVIGVTSLAVVGGLFSWILYRGLLGITVGGMVAASLVMANWPEPGAWIWTLAVVLGAVVGILVTLVTRPLVVALTALAGALGSVGTAVLIFYRLEPEAMGRAIMTDQMPLWVKVLLGAVVLALALAGGKVQYRLIDLFSPALSAEPDVKPPRQMGRSKPRKSAGRGKGRRRPAPLQKVR